MRLVSCTCDNCKKPILDWNGQIRINYLPIDFKLNTISILCEVCSLAVKVLEETKVINLEDILYLNSTVNDLDVIFTNESKDKYLSIISIAEKVSGTQLAWINTRDKQSYESHSPYLLSNEVLNKIKNADKWITFSSFFKVLQNILRVYGDELNHFSKTISISSNSSLFLQEYQEKKKLKQKLILDGAKELLKLDEGIPFYNELVEYVQNRMADAIVNNSKSADCLYWIYYELDKYLVDIHYSKKGPTFRIG